MPRNWKKTLKKKNKKNPKYSKKTPYRNSTLRTLQLATKRPTTAMLQFQKNMCFRIKPNLTASGGQHMFHLQLMANSIYDMVQDYYPIQSSNDELWSEQNVEYALIGAPTNILINADGYDDWKDRFQKYLVYGSKITVTYEPVITQEGSAGTVSTPTTLFVQKSQEFVNGVIPSSSNSGDICLLPYVQRAQILTARIGRSGQGGSVTSTFSAKKDFGLKDVQDVEGAQGATDSESFPLNGPSLPAKRCFYNIYLAETVKKSNPEAANQAMVEGIMRIKIDYITMLREPTQTNRQTVLGTTNSVSTQTARIVDEL